MSKTPNSFLISGMPRCRTAWLTAVINAHGTRVHHDVYLTGQRTDGSVNICDPAVALLQPWLRGAFDVRICIWRDPETARLALGKWAEYDMPTEAWAARRSNARLYKAEADYTYQVEDLDNDETVGEIVKLCTGKEPDMELIKIFQLMRIEEHLTKAKALMQE